MKLTPVDVARFWMHVRPVSPMECWEWQGSTATRGGYGRLSVGGEHRFAHRISYVIHKGEILPGMHICHSCDNVKCINPAHLFAGTPRDNNHDSISKGRNIHGERCKAAKLTNEQAFEIWKQTRAYVPGVQATLARKFKVSDATIHNIATGKGWAQAIHAIQLEEERQMKQDLELTVTLNDVDSILFQTLVTEFQGMYPTNHRIALKAAMTIADKVMAEFNALAAKQAKAAARRGGAEATQAPPAAQNAPVAPNSAPAAPAPARPRAKRRTKAEMMAEAVAIAKAQIAAGVPGVAVPPVAAPAPTNADLHAAGALPTAPAVAAALAPTNADLTQQAIAAMAPPPAAAPFAPEPPPVTDFAALAAQQRAQGGVPQFAPPPPPPTFG